MMALANHMETCNSIAATTLKTSNAEMTFWNSTASPNVALFSSLMVPVISCTLKSKRCAKAGASLLPMPFKSLLKVDDPFPWNPRHSKWNPYANSLSTMKAPQIRACMAHMQHAINTWFISSCLWLTKRCLLNSSCTCKHYMHSITREPHWPRIEMVPSSKNWCCFTIS